jgi:DNA-binding NtrC family response regulator
MAMGTENRSVLVVVDDDRDILTSARLALSGEFAEIHCTQEPARLPDLVRLHAPQVALVDMNFTPGATDGAEGLALLSRVRELDPGVSVVLMTAFGSVSVAVDALKKGAADFVLKPWHNEKLLATVLAARNLSLAKQETADVLARNRTLAAHTANWAVPIIGNSPEMRNALELAHRAAPSDASILILGESGTGKELMAREIHRASRRAGQAFIAVDLGAVAESLFESELFGHRRGAFTGALEDRSGLIEAATGGTLFLDEIGNLPLHLQAKLLSVLERREVVPVGSSKPRKVELRVIAATNRPARELRREEVFRRDLLYRLNTVEITLPALRERRDDIPLLVDHYAAVFARKYDVRRRRLSADAAVALSGYSWPGNVRELSHAVERATILARGESFEAEDFAFARAEHEPDDAGPAHLDDLEKGAIKRALETSQGNISHAAAALGITRTALYRRMTKYGL